MKLRIVPVALLLLVFTGGATAETFDAAKQFHQKCAMCHGADGSQPTSMGKMLGSPALTSPEIAKKPDAELKAAISNGKGKMPAYKTSLGGEQNVAAILKYVRSLKKK